MTFGQSYRLLLKYLRISIFAIRHEHPRRYLRNFIQLFWNRENTFRIIHTNGLTLQLTKVYITPIKVEICGWAFHEESNLISINFESASVEIMEIGIRANDIQDKFNLDHNRLKFYFLGRRRGQLNPIKFLVRLENGEKYHLSRNFPQKLTLSEKKTLERYRKHLVRLPIKSNKTNARISVIIPFRDKVGMLLRAIESLKNYSVFDKINLILIDNDSIEIKTEEQLSILLQRHKNISCHKYNGDFNYSEIMNFGVSMAADDLICLMNNDIEIIQTKCLERLVAIAQIDHVGIVGPKLIYEDGSIQHAGIVMTNGNPEYIWKHYPSSIVQTTSRDVLRFSAITGAFMVMRKSIFEQIGGFDPILGVALNDIDLCLKLRKVGLEVVCDHATSMIHHESASRGRFDGAENIERTNREKSYFIERWSSYLKICDPIYTDSFADRNLQ